MLKNIGLSLISLTLMVLLGEVYCRFSPPKMEKKVTLLFLPQFAHCYSSKGNSQTKPYKQVLPQRMWNSETAKTPHCIGYNKSERMKGFFPERNQNILLVGDSFTFGEGVSNQETLAYFLSQSSSTQNYLNYGHPGQSIYDVKELVETKLNETSIQKIIYVFNLNDIFPQSHPFSQGGNGADLQQVRWPRLGKDSFLIHQNWSQFLKKLAMMYTLGAQTKNTIGIYRDHYLNQKSTLYQQAVVQLLVMADNIKQSGKKFELVLYPLMHTDFWGNYPFKEIHQKIISLCHKKGLICHDGQEILENRKNEELTVHPIDQHPSGLANRLMAEFLERQWKK